ncbi:MAG: ribonuclease J [Ruminococcaceae bacterium]|nr:ribonuclease J [Oscillospiraceae bacterium]
MPQTTQKTTKQRAVRAPKQEKPPRAPKAEKPRAPKHVRKSQSATSAKLLKPKGKIRVIPLGGLQEIGKNLTVIEYEKDMIVVDCGLAFPEEDMLGVDLVIPDITYLEQNADRLRGIFLTHGHEDHIGALPYVLRSIQPPIFGTKLTLGIIKNKLEEHSLPFAPDFRTVNAGDTVSAGEISVEFIRVNHSIADACCLAIHTPLGTVIHTGDYKLDLTPIQGEMMNITRLGELGQEGVLMLLGESTNAERPGYTPSEKLVGRSLEYIFTSNPKKRIVIATFSSNVHRVQQIIDISAQHGRKVAITGRSMLNIVGAAVELGYMKVPKDVLVDISEAKRFKPEQLTLITTGSQGEPMSALYRMAYSDHNQVTLGQNDLVVLSSSAIPGNEKLVGRVINELSRNGVSVLHDNDMDVHVSGHACREELKLMLALTKPRYFMPIHGESRHLAAHRELAQEMGVPDANIFISEIGKVLEIDAKGARFSGVVPAGQVLIDGYGVGDVGSAVLRDRRLLSQDGLIVVVATVDEESRLLLSGPELISRGFVYVRDNEPLMEEARRVVQRLLISTLSSGKIGDRMQLKTRVRDELYRFLFRKTGRKPMILPVIMDV